MRPDVKRVLITGAGSGIGRALAVEAAARGMRVALVGRRREALEETMASLAGDGHFAAPGDIAQAEGRLAIVAAVTAAWPALDVMVNNAGVIEGGAFADVQDDTLTRTFAVNVVGPMALTRDLFPLLRQAPAGRVVNVGSVFGEIAYPRFAAYSASKFALRGFSSALKREWRETGVAVTYAAPRATRTAALEAVSGHLPNGAGGGDSPERVARMIWRGVERGRASIYAPGPERLFLFLQRAFPALIDRALSKPATAR